MYFLFKGVGSYWGKGAIFHWWSATPKSYKMLFNFEKLGVVETFIIMVLKCLLMHAIKWNWYSITCIKCNGYIYSHQTGWTSLVLEFLHLVSTVLFSCNLNSVKLVKVRSPYHLILCPGILPVSFATSFANATTEN